MRLHLVVRPAPVAGLSLLVLVFLLSGAGPATPAVAHGVNCGLGERAAFCDTFVEGPSSAGGRTGALDPARWSFARVSQAGGRNAWAPTDAMHCLRAVSGVRPPNDSFMCGPEFGEDMHWMEAFNDAGKYVFNSARIRQPFDIAGRTGTAVFDVDLKTAGEHANWINWWYTDQPIPAPHLHISGVSGTPRNGVLVQFSANCGTLSTTTVKTVDVFTDYQERNIARGDPGFIAGTCITTNPDTHNHLEIHISQDRLEVWGTDVASTVLKPMVTVTGLHLAFTRGYIHLQHVQYHATKGGGTAANTYHWHGIGFDGPVLPTPRAYDIPDALLPDQDRSDLPGSVYLGYGVAPAHTFTFPQVDVTEVTAAAVNLSVWGLGDGTFTYQVNDGPVQRVRKPSAAVTGAWMSLSLPVAVGDLHSGATSLTIRGQGKLAVANLDLTLETAGASASTPAGPPPGSPGTAAPAPASDRTTHSHGPLLALLLMMGAALAAGVVVARRRAHRTK